MILEEIERLNREHREALAAHIELEWLAHPVADWDWSQLRAPEPAPAPQSSPSDTAERRQFLTELARLPHADRAQPVARPVETAAAEPAPVPLEAPFVPAIAKERPPAKPSGMSFVRRPVDHERARLRSLEAM